MYNHEKETCRNIMNVHGETIFIKYASGQTCGGMTFAEYYEKFFHYSNSYGNAIRHWLSSCGLDKNGKFTYVLSDHILNA